MKNKTVPELKPTDFLHQEDSREHMSCTCDREELLPCEKLSSAIPLRFPAGSENRQQQRTHLPNIFAEFALGCCQ